MIPTIAVAPATMAVKIHVLLAWTVMESGREAIGPDPTTPEVSVALYVLPAAEAGTATTNESSASRSGARTTVRIVARARIPTIGPQRTAQAAGPELSSAKLPTETPSFASL